MENVCVDAVVSGSLEFATGSFWYEKTCSLYFVDVYKSEIHKINTNNGEHCFAKIGTESVSFIIPIENFENKFLIGYGNNLAVITWDGYSQTTTNFKILECMKYDNTENIISVAKVSPSGILFLGTTGPGYLFSDNLKLCKAGLFAFPQCTKKTVLENLSCVGGITWNRFENTVYLVDCPEYRIEKYCFNKSRCELSHGCVIYEFNDDNIPGYPNGITIDIDGNLWVGSFNGGQILKIDTRTGHLLCTIELPTAQITSLTFGGEKLQTLYVTTGGGTCSRSKGCVYKICGTGTKGCGAGVPFNVMKK